MKRAIRLWTFRSAGKRNRDEMWDTNMAPARLQRWIKGLETNDNGKQDRRTP